MNHVSIALNGKNYPGTFTVARRLLTVTTSYGSKTTEAGPAPHQALAQIVLGELVREQLREQRSK